MSKIIYLYNRAAIKRVITCIKNSILKHRNNVLRRQSVEVVAEKMLDVAASTIDSIENSIENSPSRVRCSHSPNLIVCIVVKAVSFSKSCSLQCPEHLGYVCFQPVGSGGSVLGRKSVKAIRDMMDYNAGLLSCSRCVDILSDATSSQKTPLRFPSILSKFKYVCILNCLLNKNAFHPNALLMTCSHI